MALKSKIERLFGVSKIDKHLLKLYNNYEGNNLNDRITKTFKKNNKWI
jgi:hypothetical protein